MDHRRARRAGHPPQHSGEDASSYRDRLLRPTGDAARDALAYGWADHVEGRARWTTDWHKLAALVNPRQCLLTPPGEPVPLVLSPDGARGFYLLGLAGLDGEELSRESLRDAVYFFSSTLPGRKFVQDLVPGYHPEADIPQGNLEWLEARGLWGPEERHGWAACPGLEEIPEDALRASADAEGPDPSADAEGPGRPAGAAAPAPSAAPRADAVLSGDERRTAAVRAGDERRTATPGADSERRTATPGADSERRADSPRPGEADQEPEEALACSEDLLDPEPQGLAGPCSVCGRLPGSWHKCCPVCSSSADGEEDVERVFGFRTLRGKKTPQTWCRHCRKGQPVPPGQLALVV